MNEESHKFNGNEDIDSNADEIGVLSVEPHFLLHLTCLDLGPWKSRVGLTSFAPHVANSEEHRPGLDNNIFATILKGSRPGLDHTA